MRPSPVTIRRPSVDRSHLTRIQRLEIADRLAEDRLAAINETLDEVHPSMTLYARYGKRVLDIVISLCGLVISVPFNLVIGIATYFDVGRPLFFKQERVGKNAKPFTIVKFRSMRDTTDERGELLPAAARVTRFGTFIRKTSLDELWNFWNILKGDMSILGPRPLVPEYTHRYNKRHRMRLSVRPGLECPSHHAAGHVWTWQEQFDNDVWYVENLSFKTDCTVFFDLIRFTFDRKSAAARATAQRGSFMGYSEDGQAITLADVPQAYIDAVMAESEQKA